VKEEKPEGEEGAAPSAEGEEAPAPIATSEESA